MGVWHQAERAVADAAVLADLALESEAGAVLSMRMARAYDQLPDDLARWLARGATAMAKYWVTRRALAFEAMEGLGGARYVEESMLPRLCREAPVKSIWEGSGNVQCLDVLRALQEEPELAEALLDEVAEARGENRLLDAARARLEADLAARDDLGGSARTLVERFAVALPASLLVRHAPPALRRGLLSE